MEMTPAQRIRAEANEATRRAPLESGLLETIEKGGSIPSIESGRARAGHTRGAFCVCSRQQPAATTRSFLKLLMNPA